MSKIMKKSLAVLLAVAMMFGMIPMSAFAAEAESVNQGGTWGGIDWTLTEDGTLTIAPTAGTPVPDPISGKTYEVGAWREAVRYDAGGTGKAIEGWPYDRTKVTKLVIEEGVTSIGSFAAQHFANLTGEVVIPSTVTYIGQEAFQGSTFTKLTFAKGGTQELCIAQGAFKNLIIEEVSLPDDRPVHLHAWVFNNCHNLKTATLPATLTGVHGTNHIDYFKDFNAHSNPTWTKASEIFAYDENLEIITYGNEAVRDMFLANNNGTSKDYTVATVGLTTYCDFMDAIEAAGSGEVVTLVKNISLAETIDIKKEVTLDLNGKTISGKDNNEKGNFYLFDNRGTLIIQDSVGTGAITLTAEVNRAWDASSVVVANNPGGNLTVNGGRIEHLGGTDMAYAIDNLTNGKGTYAETTINGGTVKSPYRAVRQFLNGVEAQNILTINGGTIEGANKAIFFQDPSEKANTGTLTVDANATVNGGVYLYVTKGSTEWPVNISIAADALTEGSEVSSKNLPEGYKVENENGTYSVGFTYEGGTWGGIDWKLYEDGTLVIAPTAGTPVPDPISGKTYEVGAWREAVRYDAGGTGKAIEGWPYDRTKVTKLVIEEGVTSIGSFAAQYFTNLTGEVVIPSTVTYIGQEAFQGSTFTKLTFAKGGTQELCIAQGAFKNLIIEEVSLPDDRPVHLHAWVFNNCHNLKTATLPATLTSVHGTNHIDYFKDFNAHSNPTWTKSSEIFAYDENLEIITYGNEAVRDMFLANNNGTSKDYTVATVGLTTYCDLQDAVTAAADGETVTLVKNVTLSGTVEIEKAIVLDLNGKKITGAGDALALNVKADTTITNGTIVGNYASLIDVYAALTLDGVTAGSINLMSFDATAAGPEGLMVETAVAGGKVVYANGIYKVVTTESVALNVVTGEYYEDVMEATMEAEAGQTVQLIADAQADITMVPVGTTLDLNGFKFTVNYIASYGNIVDNSEANSGLLAAQKDHILLQTNNAQIPVKDTEGYRFYEVVQFNEDVQSGPKFVFQTCFEAAAVPLLKKGSAETGVTVNAMITWSVSNGVRTQNFVYSDAFLNTFLSSYNAATEKYDKMFSLTLNGSEGLNNLSYKSVVMSELGVQLTK